MDDDANVRKVLDTVLVEAGYQVYEAATGKQARTHVRDLQPDLVITDLMMPEEEGLELIKALRSSNPDPKVIAISGAFGAQFRKIAELMGASVTLQKPVQASALLDAVRNALGRRVCGRMGNVFPIRSSVSWQLSHKLHVVFVPSVVGCPSAK